MERERAKWFYSECIVPRLPGLQAYLNRQSTANQVLSTWIDALTDCEEVDAKDVFRAIIEAREDRPLASEFGMEFVGRCRKRQGQREYKEQTKRTLQIIGERPKRSSPYVPMAELFAKFWLPIQARIEAHEITQAQGEQEWESILSNRYSSNPDTSPTPPESLSIVAFDAA